MEQYIPKSVVVAEIKRRFDEYSTSILKHYDACKEAKAQELGKILIILDTLEVKEVDLDKLGEIARHFIAVKNHIEDMRLDKEEWFMLEKIGYPERLKAQKGE